MKKIIKLLGVIVIIFCIIPSFTTQAKKRILNKKHSTTKTINYKFQLPNIYRLKDFSSLLNKYGEKINDYTILNFWFYNYPFFDKEGTIVYFMKNDDSVLIMIETPFSDEDKGFDALLDFKNAFSKKYGSPLFTDLITDSKMLYNDGWQFYSKNGEILVLASLDLNETFSNSHETKIDTPAKKYKIDTITGDKVLIDDTIVSKKEMFYLSSSWKREVEPRNSSDTIDNNLINNDNKNMDEVLTKDNNNDEALLKRIKLHSKYILKITFFGPQ